MAKQSRFDPLAVAKWAANWVANNWEKLAPFAVWAVVTYLGAIQQTVAPWGHFQWAIFFVVGSTALFFCYAFAISLLAWSQSRRALAKLTDHQIKTSTINPLRRDFSEERIHLLD